MGATKTWQFVCQILIYICASIYFFWAVFFTHSSMLSLIFFLLGGCASIVLLLVNSLLFVVHLKKPGTLQQDELKTDRAKDETESNKKHGAVQKSVSKRSRIVGSIISMIIWTILILGLLYALLTNQFSTLPGKVISGILIIYRLFSLVSSVRSYWKNRYKRAFTAYRM